MRRILGVLVALSFLLSLVFVVQVTPAGATSSTQGNSKFDHIFYVMMENHATNEVIGNTADAPFISNLANQSAVSLNYYGVTHPSLPNYLAAISGDFQGVWADCVAGATVTCPPTEFNPSSGYTNGKELLTPAEIASASQQPFWFNGKTIVDQLEAHNLSWKAYMQSMPSVGYTGGYYPYRTENGQQVPVQLYVQKHNPFMYFTDIRNNAARMQKIVPYTQLSVDLQSGKVPNFVWISPDTCHDMHGINPSDAQYLGMAGCAYPASGLDHSIINMGDTFVQSLVSQIMASQAWKENSAIVLVWDENDFSGFNGCCHSPRGVAGVTLGGANAPSLVITSQHPQHFYDSSTPYNHYSLLATIEQLWGLGCLRNTCGFNQNELMTRFFSSTH
ncbi:MAG: alkaline phosphatase family protein [Ktedonobacteraceae bacterium]